MGIRVGVAGASGYAGGELLRLLARPSGGRDRRADRRRSSAGSRSASTSRTCVPLADRVLEPTTAETLAGHDVVVPRAAARRSRPRWPPSSGRRRVVVDCGADLRLRRPGGLGAVLRRRPRRHLALRPARAAAAAARSATAGGARRIAVPGCYPTAVDAWPSLPAFAAGLVEPTTSSSSRRPAPPAPARRAQAAPARLRGDGLADAVRRRRRPPAHPRDRAEPRRGRRDAGRACRFTPCSRRCRAASSPPARRRLRPGVDATEVRAAYVEAYADEPFVHLLPEGQWPQTADRPRRQHRATCRSPSTQRAGRVVVGRRDRQPDQGHRRRRRPVA